MKRSIAAGVMCVVGGLIAASCGGTAPTPTPRAIATTAPAPSATAAPSASPQPTQPPSPVPTAQATPTPRPTATPQPTAAPTATASPAGPKRGGQLVLPVEGPVISSFQPGISNPSLGIAQYSVGRMLYQSLLWFDPYENNRIDGLLADKWTFSPAADELTLHLRPSARWADGKPLVAQDVKFSIDNFMVPPKGFVTASATKLVGTSVASLQVVDDSTVSMKLKAPDVSFVSLLGDVDVLIRPAHRTLEQSATTPMGSGSFQLKAVQTDIKMTFQRNPNAWMRNARGEPLPYLDGMERVLIGDAAKLVGAFITGQLDLIHADYPSQVQGGKQAILKAVPDVIFEYRYGGNIGWGFKNAPPFDNPKVRQAMSMLTDRLALVEYGYAGEGVIDSITLLPGSSNNQWSLPSAEFLSQPGWRYVDRKTRQLETDMGKLAKGLSSTYEKDPADIEKAWALLKEAGYERGKFPKFTIAFPSRYEQRAISLIQPMRQGGGLLIDAEVVEDVAYDDRVRQGRFQAVVQALSATSFEPSFGLLPLTTGNAPWPHGFQVPSLDELFKRQKAETDPAKRRDLIFEMQRKLLADPHMIPGGNFLAPAGAIRAWVKDVPMPVVNQSNVYGLERVWTAK